VRERTLLTERSGSGHLRDIPEAAPGKSDYRSRRPRAIILAMRTEPPVAAPLTRATRGRWIGGVCAGIAQARDVPVGAVRAAFALTAALGGLGVVAYLAWWLIVPAEGEEDAAPRTRPLVTLVLAGAGAAGLATLATLGAAATVFGLGWVVAALAAVVLAGGLASWRRTGPSWALLPVAALVLPSVALAAADVHLARETGDRQVAPRALADVPRDGYESGLGELMVDLRHTDLPRAGTHTLRIDGGVRRTIVALPHDRCVPVTISYTINSFALRAASVLAGHTLSSGYDGATLFGDAHWTGSGELTSVNDAHAPMTLHIDFTSAGGGLYVRDYPDRVDPRLNPDWPGYPLGLSAGPDTRSDTRKVARRRIAEWRRRHAREVRAVRRVERFRAGPCARTGASA
jgi:phage shock protein PspC (stress-responsive transcriptional regulator)